MTIHTYFNLLTEVKLNKIIMTVTFAFGMQIFATHPAVITGNEYLKVKDYENAYKSYSSVLVENSKDKSALYGKSYALFKMKKYSEALESFKQLIEIDKSFRDTLYRTAYLYRKLKNYDQAIKHYKEYLKIKPNDPDTYYGLARTYEQLNDKVKAAYYFYLYTIKEKRPSEEKWVKKAKNKIEKYRSKFTEEEQNQYASLINSKESGNSVTEKKEITQKSEPQITTTPKTLSKPQTVQKEKINKITPSTQKSELNIPPADKSKATSTHETSVDKTLNYIFMKGVKGDELYLAGKYNDAIIEYRKNLTDPLKRREALYKMAVCNAMLKKYSTAVKLLSKIILEEEGNARVRELLKLMLVNKKVVETLKEADSNTKNKIGMEKVNELISRGDYYEAIKLLDILQANIKNNSSALLYKIDLLRILSKYDEIEKELKNFLKIYPDNILVNEKYADFLASQNKKNEALKYYNLALSKTKDKEIQNRIKSKISSVN